MSTDIPPQLLYNVGQKLFAHQTLISGMILFMTGMYMFLAVVDSSIQSELYYFEGMEFPF